MSKLLTTLLLVPFLSMAQVGVEMPILYRGPAGGGAPVISSVSCGSQTSTTITISWNTDIATTGNIVTYSLNSDLSSSSTANAGDGGTSHTKVITGLSAGRTYYWQVQSTANSQTTLGAVLNCNTSSGVALVGANKTEVSSTTGISSSALSTPSSVVSGNTVIFAIGAKSAALAPSAGMLTKTGGTCTIGTISMDQALNASDGTTAALGIYRVPITGSGSLTLTFTPGGSGWSIIVWVAEFSGMAASPWDSGGSGTDSGTSSGSGLAQGETSGSVSSTSPLGIVIYVASEIHTINWTRSVSDTLVFSDSNGTTDMTGVMQYKIINGTPNTLTSNVQATGIAWWSCFASYKSL